MQRVIAINLNGNAYQLDEDAYDALRAYLGHAETQLDTNPDRREIVADLEQAIAEKCQRFLGPHKTVVAVAEINQVLKEMGPVDGGHGDAAAHGDERADGASGGKGVHADTSAAPRRLYQIREGSMISGVCNGIGAYLNIDPTIVRVLFVLLAIVTGGGFGLVYLSLMFVIPYATTSEERAAAQGVPFTAQDMIDRAKQNYSEFKNKHWKDTKWQWRQQRREWKRQMRINVDRWVPPPAAVPAQIGYVAHVLRGILVPIFAVANAAISIMFVIALLSLLRSNSVWGWTMPPGTPMWMGILVLVVAYQVLAAPFRLAHRFWYYGYGPYGHASVELMSGLIWVVCTIVFFWLAYQHVPAVREFMQQFPWWTEQLQRV